MAWTRAQLKSGNYTLMLEHLGTHVIGYVYRHSEGQGYSIIHQRVYDTFEQGMNELAKAVEQHHKEDGILLDISICE